MKSYSSDKYDRYLKDKYGFILKDATGYVFVNGLSSEKGGSLEQFQIFSESKGIQEGDVITIIGHYGRCGMASVPFWCVKDAYLVTVY